MYFNDTVNTFMLGGCISTMTLLSLSLCENLMPKAIQSIKTVQKNNQDSVPMDAKAAHLKHSVLERRITLKPSDDVFKHEPTL